MNEPDTDQFLFNLAEVVREQQHQQTDLGKGFKMQEARPNSARGPARNLSLAECRDAMWRGDAEKPQD